MQGNEAVVLHLNRAVFIVNGREIKRVAHHLPPMLPASSNIVVVEIITTTDMILEGGIMVVINSTTLVFRIDIFEHDVAQPRTVFQIQFSTQQTVLEII